MNEKVKELVRDHFLSTIAYPEQAKIEFKSVDDMGTGQMWCVCGTADYTGANLQKKKAVVVAVVKLIDGELGITRYDMNPIAIENEPEKETEPKKFKLSTFDIVLLSAMVASILYLIFDKFI